MPFLATKLPLASAPRMVINFMGLVGPSGVLPLYYTELIVERIRQKDRAMLNFLDIFHHRMTSLFYQAWENNETIRWLKMSKNAARVRSLARIRSRISSV